MKNISYINTIATFFIFLGLFVGSGAYIHVHATGQEIPVIQPTPLPSELRLARPIQVEEIQYYPVNMDEVYVSTPYSSLHPGIDFAAKNYELHPKIASVERGTVVYAADTRVDESEFGGGYGKLIVIEHSDGYLSLYAHLDKIFVAKGDIVQQGQELGIMGSTGNSTGRHLHFEMLTEVGSNLYTRHNPSSFEGTKKVIRLLAQGEDGK